MSLIQVRIPTPMVWIARVRVGVTIHEIFCFRTPRLMNDDNIYDALKELGFFVCLSIDDGWDVSQDGTDFLRPHTLEGGSPGSLRVKSQPGLWQMHFLIFAAKVYILRKEGKDTQLISLMCVKLTMKIKINDTLLSFQTRAHAQ